MLNSIYIENIALIKKLSLEPSAGFCAFTGETGAGKSIIIDSLGLLCGARSDKSIIRTGEEYALVEGIFSVDNADFAEFLHGLDIETEDDGSITVSRRLTSDGKSVAKINGRACPVSRLKSVMSRLISIHGQQDTQSFADGERQLYMLDSFAENGFLVSDYKNKYSRYKNISEALNSLNEDGRERELRLDMLKYRVNELKSANVQRGEKEALLSERKRLSNAEKIVTRAGEAYGLLYGNDGSAAENAEKAYCAVNALSGIIPEAEDLASRLESVKYELIDIADSMKTYLEDDGTDIDKRLDECETRIELIKRLENKYRTDSENFGALLSEWNAELDAAENSDEEKSKLESELKNAEKALEKSAAALRNSRIYAAKLLCEKMTEELCELDMPDIAFMCDIRPREDYGANGKEEAEFLISANKGELPKPMAKIASGGELSRIMLCLKCVFADSEAIGTLIFDEIDAGVSGKTSEKIAIRLKKAADGGKTQVICVTHSAIVASKADAHYKILKRNDGERTVTEVSLLDREGRKNELARILGGLNITDRVLDVAEEMLEI